MKTDDGLRRRVLRRQRRRVLGASLLLMGHQTCEALVPLAIGFSVDRAVATGDVRMLVLCLAGFVLLFGVLNTCYRWFARLGQGAVIDEGHLLRTELAGRLLRPGATTARRHGELLTIASSDADQTARSVIWVSGLCGSAAALLVSSAILIGIDPLLGLGLIVTAVVVTLGLNALSPLLSRRVAGQQESLAEASALATDLVTGLRVLHGLGAQRTATARYREVSRRAESAGVRTGTAKSLQLGATVLAATLVLAVSVASAGLLAVDGTITIGAFVSAVGAAQFIAEPLTAAGFYLQIGAAAKASAARVGGVLDEAPVVEPVEPVRLDLPAGRLTGIVAEPEVADRLTAALRERTVTFDGAAPEAVHVEPHHAHLFAGTVAENMALSGVPGDLRPAIVAAGAADFVDAQSAGLDEPVRDRGLSLSGGQRQRLALARALHADPPVLVLRDPTTAIDSVTEESVAQGLRTLRRDRTTVVITDSPVLLAHADHVVHLAAEGVLAEGTHHDLLAHEGYRKKVLG
ncbi:ABC transporter transmembrane domain-containing protein [Pseudonocardia oroxyli]|uniref:Putative ABC transport system ATP-binding protein n=1 Tax=Pseudonocardia oroxyli TaxID=366584 RepID=A0A1G7WGA2_PSEOR|nr:ABC transporter ATP-binding protein [Pseudonocardia oroxyli]SDG70894.1 putative ABC transport system ATP-binding protein [Pseudonocardia oroxyli]